MSALERVTLRYLTQFRCIGGSCRENCCTGLKVQLSEQNHRRLAERSAKIPELQALFERVVRLEPAPERTSAAFASIAPEGPECPFLDQERLCVIHARAGEEALADACSLLPRMLAQVNGRLELSATLACPEAARLCLTTEGSVDSVPWEPSMMAREIVVRTHAPSEGDLYDGLLDDVRQLCIDVLLLEGAPISAKLLVLLDLAIRVEPFFYRGTTTSSPERLRAEVDGLGQRLASVTRTLSATPRADVRAVRGLAEMLLARLGTCDNRRFNELVRPMLLRNSGALREQIVAYFQGRPAVAKDVEALRGMVARRSELLERRFGPRVDLFIQRAAVNSVVKDWYTQQPTLAGSLRRLIVRLALSRFVLLMHEAFGESTHDAQFDDLAVDAFQIIAKNVEHAPTFMSLCEAYLTEQTLDSVSGLALLLCV